MGLTSASAVEVKGFALTDGATAIPNVSPTQALPQWAEFALKVLDQFSWTR